MQVLRVSVHCIRREPLSPIPWNTSDSITKIDVIYDKALHHIRS
jgi:hypothetical protein